MSEKPFSNRAPGRRTIIPCVPGVGPRPAGLCLALLVGLVGCEGSPVASEPELVVVKGVAVRHDDGMELRLLRYNESWYPRDDAPRPEPGEVFMTFLVEVRNGGADVLSSSPNHFALRTFEGTRHEGPVRVPRAGGREPALAGATLPPGESVPDAEIVVTTVRVVPPPSQETTVGGCTGNPLTTRETRTGEDGWYEQPLSAVHVDLMCLDVQVIPAPEAGFPPARSAGTVRLGLPIPMVEPPEVRVDLTVPAEVDG